MNTRKSALPWWFFSACWAGILAVYYGPTLLAGHFGLPPLSGLEDGEEGGGPPISRYWRTWSINGCLFHPWDAGRRPDRKAHHTARSTPSWAMASVLIQSFLRLDDRGLHLDGRQGSAHHARSWWCVYLGLLVLTWVAIQPHAHRFHPAARQRLFAPQRAVCRIRRRWKRTQRMMARIDKICLGDGYKLTSAVLARPPGRWRFQRRPVQTGASARQGIPHENPLISAPIAKVLSAGELHTRQTQPGQACGAGPGVESKASIIPWPSPASP